MSDELVRKVAGKETIEHLKEDLLLYSTRELTPNQVYLLISKTKEYEGIDTGVIKLMMGQVLGNEYVSKINFPESKSYEPEFVQSQPVQPQSVQEVIPETIQKPKKKRSKKGLIIGLATFLTLASIGGYFGYQEYQRDQVRKKQLEKDKAFLQYVDELEKQRISKDIYLGPVVCNVCHGKKEDTCGVCKGKKEVMIGEYIPEKQIAVECSYCKGTGYAHSQMCYVCNGNGKILKTRNAIDNQKYVSCDNCVDKETRKPTGLVACFNCKGTGTDGDQMATIVCDGLGVTKDTLKKWIRH